MMRLVKISFVFVQFVFFLNKNGAAACKTVSFTNINIVLDYSQKRFRSAMVSDCFSLMATIAENSYLGPVTGITAIDQPIPVLKAEAVANFSELAIVIFQGNNITAVEECAFSNLPKLTFLRLSNNKISFLEEDTFFNVPALQQVELDSNRFKYFEQSWLSRATHICCLKLANNLIESIPKQSFTKLSFLTYLDTSHNLIMHIHEKAFEGLNRLDTLDLSYNRISHLSDNLFIPTTNLRILNLFSNHLTYISDSVLESLAMLDVMIIRFNPLICECYEKVRDWAVDNKSVDVQIYHSFQCYNAAVSDVPICVTTDRKKCMSNIKDDLISVLHSGHSNYYECFLVGVCQTSRCDIKLTKLHDFIFD